MYINRILAIVFILFTLLVSCDSADITKGNTPNEITLREGSVVFLISTKNLISGNYSFESLEIKISRDGGQIIGEVFTEVSSLIDQEGNIELSVEDIPLSSSPSDVEITLLGTVEGASKSWYGKENDVVINSEILSLTIYIYDTSTLESGTLDLTISINNKPVIEAINISNASPSVNESITFTAMASDDDNDLLFYRWEFDGTYYGEGTQVSTTKSFSTSGSHTVTLKVYDLYNDNKKDEDISFDEFTVEFYVSNIIPQ